MQTRKSNIELMRVVLMCMIIAHHLIVHGLGLRGMYDNTYCVDNLTIPSLFVNSFLIASVNAFVFASGYFCIRFKPEKLVAFVLQAIFYSLCIYMLFVAAGVVTFDLRGVVRALVPITRGEWWFLVSYLGLYVVSPFLNGGFSRMTQKEARLLVILLLLFDCVWGFPFGSFSEFGHSVFHFITLYILAGYLRMYPVAVKYAGALFIVSSLLLFLSSLGLVYTGRMMWMGKLFSINNPLAVLAAVALFYLFLRLSLKNNILINRAGATVFGVYLIHDHTLAREFLVSVVTNLRVSFDTPVFLLCLLLLVPLIFLISASVETLRIRLFTPVSEFVRRLTSN